MTGARWRNPKNGKASAAGLEPATFGFGGRRSIQLSYADIDAILASTSAVLLHGQSQIRAFHQTPRRVGAVVEGCR